MGFEIYPESTVMVSFMGREISVFFSFFFFKRLGREVYESENPSKSLHKWPDFFGVFVVILTL